MRFALSRDVGKTIVPAVLLALGLVLVMATSSAHPQDPIKGTFLNFYRNLTPELWALEFKYMKNAGIKTVVLVSAGRLQAAPTTALSCSLGMTGSYQDSSGFTLAQEGLLYPSALVSGAQRPAVDLLETVLALADLEGMDVYVGSLQTATDWTDGTEFCALRTLNQQVASEVLQLYGRHPSFKGWYFTQEVWMNWVKFYGQQQSGAGAAGYYGANLTANWIADMKALDAGKLTTAAVVVKETGAGGMPGLTAPELQQWTTSFLQTANLDILMPQDGAGAQAGAPPLSDLPAYYAAMAAAIPAAGTKTDLWSTTELFTASSDAGLGGEQYPPTNDISRVEAQVSAVRPYVSGYVSWLFGDDLSPQATYYPVEADELNRKYAYTFGPPGKPYDDMLPLTSYSYPSVQPDPSYPDSADARKLSDGTGGGYGEMSTWVGFFNPSLGASTVQVVGDLGSSQVIHAVRALTQSWMYAGVLHPAAILAEVSQDGVNWTQFGSSTSFPSDAGNFAVMWGEVDGNDTGRYVRWTFTYSQWLMLAELEVLGPAADSRNNSGKKYHGPGS